MGAANHTTFSLRWYYLQEFLNGRGKKRSQVINIKMKESIRIRRKDEMEVVRYPLDGKRFTACRLVLRAMLVNWITRVEAWVDLTGS